MPLNAFRKNSSGISLYHLLRTPIIAISEEKKEVVIPLSKPQSSVASKRFRSDEKRSTWNNLLLREDPSPRRDPERFPDPGPGRPSRPCTLRRFDSRRTSRVPPRPCCNRTRSDYLKGKEETPSTAQLSVLEVSNLPENRTSVVIKNRLKHLSLNCGGKVLHVNDGTALLKFSSPDIAERVAVLKLVFVLAHFSDGEVLAAPLQIH
ncbi:unnamed protein product [Darwinula stevensoni]|uniref:MARF1 RNA recognition motif 1 domain-containing protein n=1 Tax=Darwinula stevensoni TaxID=69355 RepID=A0A7R8XBN6_9CRUS|nr:unnamed protein product [Darwinula stevensoni]CAG0891183.1 unnamed protein product [Darwinula stevensoni]